MTKANAADYTAGFAIDANASHNDNIQLVKTDKTEVRKYDLSPKLTLGLNTETTTAQLDSTFDFNHYDKSQYDSNDQNISLTLVRQFERSSLGLNANYLHNSTITSEQLTTGRIGDKAERAEQYTLSPNWSYLFTESNQIQLSGTYTVQSYESSAYIGYKNTGAELDWVHIVNEKLKLVTAATYSKYNSDNLTINVPGFSFQALGTDGNIWNVEEDALGQQSYSTQMKDKGLQVGLNYQWSEQSLISAQLGRSYNDTTLLIHDSANICSSATYLSLPDNIRAFTGALCDIPAVTSRASTAKIDWTWNNELQQFDLNATKSTQPTANGYAVDSTQINANWSYQLSELNKVLATTTIVRNRSINSISSAQTASANRNYGSATLQYQRQLSEYWFLSASFEFSEQKYTETDYQASSRTYLIGVSYRPQQWHWSR